MKYRVATIYQLIRDIDNSQARRHFSPRLKRLAEAGYLNREWYGSKLVYSLGTNGQKLLFESGVLPKQYQLSHIGNVCNKTGHDISLNDVYHAIEKIDVIQSLKTHNQQIIDYDTHRNIFNIPDGLFQVPCNDKKVTFALELELSLKSPTRYKKVFRLYHKDKSISVVLYIAGNKNIKDRLLRYSGEFFKQRTAVNKIFITTLDEFIKTPESCRFESANGRFLSFTSLADHSTERVIETLTKKNEDWAPLWAPCPNNEFSSVSTSV